MQDLFVREPLVTLGDRDKLESRSIGKVSMVLWLAFETGI